MSSLDDWQPIGSAPKNDFIQVCRAGRQYVAKWYEEWGIWGVSAEQFPGSGEEHIVSISAIVKNGKELVPGPSHWAPLRPLPSATDG
jgi:hypothetical protein